MLAEVEQALTTADAKLVRVRKAVADIRKTAKTLRAVQKSGRRGRTFARANNLQQSWRFDWEPPKAVLRDVWTKVWILGC